MLLVQGQKVLKRNACLLLALSLREWQSAKWLIAYQLLCGFLHFLIILDACIAFFCNFAENLRRTVLKSVR